jgi:hypothetical protein
MIRSIHTHLKTNITNATPYTLTMYNLLPPPTATPTAALNQTDAAVVRPCTSCEEAVTILPSTSFVEVDDPFHISPAPRNPTPLGTAAA